MDRRVLANSEMGTERALLAAILQQALDDCLHERGGEATLAYLWVLQTPECEAYCEWLDINYERFRAAVIRLAGQRCERLLRLRSVHAADSVRAKV